MKVGIKDIAKDAGVSATTVSHVINRTRYVSPEVTERVNDSIKRLNYIPNIMARNLRNNETKIVAVIVQQTSSMFFSKVFDEIANVLYSNGYSVFLCTTKEVGIDEKMIFTSMVQQQVCGIILSPQQRDFDYRTLCPKENFPLVFIDRKTDISQSDVVICDNCDITNEAVKMLISKGHKRIGYIASQRGIAISTSSDRFHGYKNALKESGLEFREDLVVCLKEQSFASGYLAMQQLLKVRGVTACFVAESPMAQGAFKCLIDNGVAVPDEMAFVCFDDFEWAEITTPSLTTIRQSMSTMGKRAAEILLERIKEPGNDYIEEVLASEVILRNSC